MKDKGRKIVFGLVILGLAIIAVCNVFLHRTAADVTLAIGVILMGSMLFSRIWKENT